MSEQRIPLKATGTKCLLSDLLDELDREIAWRKAHYPEWAANYLQQERGEAPTNGQATAPMLPPEEATIRLEKLVGLRMMVELLKPELEEVGEYWIKQPKTVLAK